MIVTNWKMSFEKSYASCKEMQIISHPPVKGFERKLLSDHLESVASASKGAILDLDLDLSLITQCSLADLAFKIGLLHDIGKASEYFQAKITNQKDEGALCHHSLVSAVIAYQNLKEVDLPSFAAPLAFKLIQRHHGNLDSLESTDTISNLIILQTVRIYESISENVSKSEEMLKFLDNHQVFLRPCSKNDINNIFDSVAEFTCPLPDKETGFELFIITNLLFSLLIEHDKVNAAHLDFSDYPRIVSTVKYDPKSYMQSKLNVDQQNPINHIRQDFFKSVSENTNISSDQFLYTIAAPTGIGKTLAAMNLIHSLQGKLKNKRRVIYCLPYTSIIDQNYAIYENVITCNHPESRNELYRYIIRHHHLQDYFKLTSHESEYDYWDYLNDLLVVESWVSAMVVSTFVQFFHTLIGNRNSMLKKLHNIINSIVVLDEIQNIDPSYYNLLRLLFKVLASRFKTYIILSTATCPYLLDSSLSVELSKPEYFQHSLFNRVTMFYDPKPVALSELYSTISSLDFENMLIILNTRKAVKQTYEYLLSQFRDSYAVFCLTTDHLPLHRTAILHDVKSLLCKKKRVILVSTQLVEAGVDISFQMVIRDFAPWDSIVQCAGRCNRNGEYGILGGSMYLRQISDEDGTRFSTRIYNKYLLQQTAVILSDTSRLQSKDFFMLTRSYYNSLDCDAIGNMFINAISSLNYDLDLKGELPISRFKLIEDNYDNTILYILYDKDIQREFNRYLNLKDSMGQKQVKEEDNEAILLEILRIQNKLKGFSLSVYRSSLSSHIKNNIHLHQLSDNAFYVNSEDVPSIYSINTGLSDKVIEYYSQGQL